MNKEKTVLQVVQNLNEELYEKTKSDDVWYSYTMDNYIDSVTFNLFSDNSVLKIDLWNSENSQRAYNEETDDYEPLEETIKRELKEVASYLNTLTK